MDGTAKIPDGTAEALYKQLQPALGKRIVAAMTTTLQATARKDGRWWTVQCVEYPGAISQVARLDQAVEHITEAVAFVAELDPAAFTVEVHPVLSDEILQELATFRRLRDEARAADAQARELVRAAARAMRQEGLTVRDIGAVLDVSYQRAHQLVSS